VLALWREAVTGKAGDNQYSVGNKVTDLERRTGNSCAYTLSRLKREAPALFRRVAAGELSAKAAGQCSKGRASGCAAGARAAAISSRTVVKAWFAVRRCAISLEAYWR
jgi:hypothetical protein